MSSQKRSALPGSHCILVGMEIVGYVPVVSGKRVCARDFREYDVSDSRVVGLRSTFTRVDVPEVDSPPVNITTERDGHPDPALIGLKISDSTTNGKRKRDRLERGW